MIFATASLQEIEQWVHYHNQYRLKHQVAPVTWSATVAKSAQAFADECPQNHSNSGYGENLAWGYPSIRSVVTAWYSEEQSYNYNAPGFSATTGHFTQVVWKGTKEIGCALRKECSGWPTTWVCQYSPPGNYIGQFAQNVFPAIPTTTPQGSPTLAVTTLLLEEK
jgi:uncharacterized protein YkwD